MPRAEPIYNHRHYLNMDKFTYEFNERTILAYERAAFNEFRLMFNADMSYETFEDDDCAFCANLRLGLELGVWLRFFPELQQGLKDMARKDNLAYWHNAYALQKLHGLTP